MTTKELIESEPSSQHKSEGNLPSKPKIPAFPSSECDCQDCNLPDLGSNEDNNE